MCDLRYYIKTNLKISDWVLINGRLSYQKVNLNDNVRSYIEVKNIQKLARRADMKQPDDKEN